VVWIKIISYQMLRATFVSYRKQNNTKNQFLHRLNLLRDSFCFHEAHTFYSFFPWNQKNKKKELLYRPYRVGGLIISKHISSLFETNHELCIYIFIDFIIKNIVGNCSSHFTNWENKSKFLNLYRNKITPLTRFEPISLDY
jgi:hypothetical protein